MTEVTAGITALTTIVGDVFTMITGNAVLAVFLGASLVGTALGVFRKLKSTASSGT